MLTRRASSLALAGTVAAGRNAGAATPTDTAVMAKAIDDITSFDPHESFEASGGEVITKTWARQHQAALLHWGSDCFDPHSNAQAFRTNPDSAAMRTVAWRNVWQDASISDRAAANLRELDTAKRLAQYETLQRESLERSPFVILFQQLDAAAPASPWVGSSTAPAMPRPPTTDIPKPKEQHA